MNKKTLHILTLYLLVIYSGNFSTFSSNNMENHNRNLQLKSKVDLVQTLNHDNYVYTTLVTVGSTESVFTLELDTTLQWTWVAGKGILNKVFPNTYDCSASSTCDQTSTTASIQVRSGNFSGTVVNETIKLQSGQIIENFPILVIDNGTFGPTDIEVDGGLALAPIGSNPGYLTFYEMLVEAGAISKPVFSLYLSNNPTSSDTYSELIVGDFDEYFMIGNFLLFLNILQNSTWIVGMSEIIVNNSIIQTNASTGIFDSSSDTIKIPTSDYNLIISSIGTIPAVCDNEEDLGNLPVITFVIGDSTLNYEFLVYGNQYAKIDTTKNTCIILFEDNGQDCESEAGCIWNIGLPFLANYYTYFDSKNNKIGIIPAKDRGRLPLEGFITYVISLFEIMKIIILTLMMMIV